MRISDWSSDVCSSDLPTRQNIYESTAIDIISAFDSQLVSRFEKLPGGGSNAIYIQGRALRTGAQLIEASSKETKSIDFRWWIPRSDGEIEVYASHKYTQEPKSEERRVGKACVSMCRSRWSQYH